MPQTQAQKKTRVFSFVPSSSAPRRYRERPSKTFASEELRLRDELQAIAAEIRDDDGRPVSSHFDRWARGLTRPLSIFAHLVVVAAKHGADESTVIAIAERLTQFVREVFQKYGRNRNRRAA